jgi:putative hydrolase of the HAD superfamily
MRRMTLERAMHLAGDDPMHVDAAFEAFSPSATASSLSRCADALQRLAARAPLAALSNGNADLVRIGVHTHFAFQLGGANTACPSRPSASSTLPARAWARRRTTCSTWVTTSTWT